MVVKEISFNSTLYELAKRLREELLRRPHGLALSADDLKGEDTQIHIAAIEGGEIIGTVILKPVSAGVVKLRQMAVAKATQGTGVGRQLVRFAEQVALSKGYGTIEMHARVSAIGFYKTLGYETAGGKFIVVTIPHVNMVKQLRPI